MHACVLFAAHSIQYIAIYSKWTLWTMINSYLQDSAFTGKDQTTGEVVYPKWFCFTEFQRFEAFWQWHWILTHPTLKKMAQCSMITPLIFSQTVTKTTSRGHILLQGKICIVRYCFLWKYMEDLWLWYLAFWVLFLLSTATYLGVGYSDTVTTGRRQLVSYRSVTKPVMITWRNLF